MAATCLNKLGQGQQKGVMEITVWAQEYFQKSLSINIIHCKCRLKLCHENKKPYVNMNQRAGPKLI